MIQKLLWDVRKYPELARRFREDPDSVLEEYGVQGEERVSMKALDFKSLYEQGANPYLLYFCAIQLEIDRAQYYAQLRGEPT